MTVHKSGKSKQQNQNHRESGNAFFIVMVGVILFAALMFTFSRGARQGGDNLSTKQAEIAADDILSYSQLVERAVTRVYSKSFSESAFSFQNTFISGYENANCTQARCRIFNSNGGGISYRPLAQDWSRSQSQWIFTGHNPVLGVGRDCADPSCSELLMMIEDVPTGICLALNKKLNLGTTIPNDDDVDTTPYDGDFDHSVTFDLGDEDSTLVGIRTACFQRNPPNGNYYFYHVLLER